jgi:hypothetical protein
MLTGTEIGLITTLSGLIGGGIGFSLRGFWAVSPTVFKVRIDRIEKDVDEIKKDIKRLLQMNGERQ